MASYKEISDAHLDALRELGNIGAGNAATSLGVLLDEDVSIGIPEVRVEDFSDVVRDIGGPEEMCVAVLVNFTGDISGIILFILSIDDANGITGIIASGKEDGASGASELSEISDLSDMSDIKLSGIKELGNILGSSYLGSIAALTGTHIELSVPQVAIDMAGAILTAPVSEYGVADNKVMFIEESFSTRERRFRGHVIMFTDIITLRDIVKRLELRV
jgi:chemotaxis protein CheC